MKKINRLLLTLVFLMFFVVFPRADVLAQTAKSNEHWACLKGARCDTGVCKGMYLPDGTFNPIYHPVHRVRLTTDPKNKPYPGITYVLECLSVDGAQVCTTGTAKNDAFVFNKLEDSLDLPFNKAHDKVKYVFEGMFKENGLMVETNPINNFTAEIGPLEWQSETTDTARKYMTLNFITPDQAAAGAGQTLQQGTVNWVTANQECDVIRWDPYGRVFNSMTLEPVMNVKVTLEKYVQDPSTGLWTWIVYNDVQFGKVQNPVYTQEDGAFSFVVEDGTYQLRLVSPTGLQFPYGNDYQKIHPNNLKIYSDLYPGRVKIGLTTTEIYNIIQAGKIQHRDIPLATQLGVIAASTDIKLMESFYNKIGGKAVVKGRSSHPFARVSVYTVTGNPPVRLNKLFFGKQLSGNSQAGKDGWFTVEIDESGFAKGEMFGEIDLEKINLTGTTLSKVNPWYGKLLTLIRSLLTIGGVSAQTTTSNKTTVSFQPIPSYIEGYAYDAKGNVLANSTVGVYLEFSNRPYSETKTDVKGYYRFSSEALPNMPYGIRYTNATGGVTKTTTGQFITQNKQYFTTGKVDPYVYKDQAGNPIKIVNRPTNLVISDNKTTTGQSSSKGGGKTGIFSIQGTGGGSGSQATSSTTPVSQTNPLIIVAIIFLILILVVGGILTFYLIKKNQTPSETPMQ